MLVQTIYPGITPKTQLKRYVSYCCVYDISFPTQLSSIPEYYQNLEKSPSATSIILMNQYSTYVQEVKECTLTIHNSFAVNGSLNESLLWKERIHTNKRGLQQLAFDFITDVRYRRFLNQ